MADRVDLYGAYGHFGDRVVSAIREETFGEDIGQNSWLTVDEFDRFVSWLGISADDHVLEVASGSGGPALSLVRKVGCRVTGIDANEGGVATACRMAEQSGEGERLRFRVADANSALPFEDGSFDGLFCIDALNHLPDRLAVFREWHRVLRKGRRAVFTDPVVITGPVTNEELATRSSIGLFLFVPPGVNESLIEKAGLRLVRQADVTENAVLVSSRWRRAREAHGRELLRIEGRERFDDLQRFFDAVHRLTSERRLSRIAYVAEK